VVVLKKSTRIIFITIWKCENIDNYDTNNDDNNNNSDDNIII
jgi:hypothetical protein